MKAPITFEPSGVTIWVDLGTTVHQAALEAGVPLSAPCGGRGVCGACGVRVVEGSLAPPDDVEADRLFRLRPGVRLGCRARVERRVVVRPVISLGPEASPRGALPADARTAVAVDLGTTNVSAVAVDMDSGVEGPVGTVPNLQAAYGADVLSRVAAAARGKRDDLSRAARDSVEQAVGLALAGVERSPESVVIAGNTAMESLLAGVDSSSLGAHPFAAPRVPSVSAVPLRGADVHARLMPVLASFVGGDTAACLLHTGMVDRSRTRLLVDLGTNAEIALTHDGFLWVASAAAGPAFEASGIECGGVTGPGSILSVDWDPLKGWTVETLSGVPAERFAGSGLVSVVALLRRLGHLRADGAMVSEGPLASAFMVGNDGVLRVRIGDDAHVNLSQLDVRSFQLAKAAVRVAIEFVMRTAGVSAKHVEDVFVAGAFGSSLRTPDLVEVGIVPSRSAMGVSAVGNASLYGALATAVSPSLIDELNETAASTRHVELAGDDRFEPSLMAALTLEPYDV